MSDQADIDQCIEQLYQSESVRFIAVLTRAFGFHRHQLIEDVVHTALLEAIDDWKRNGTPDNPSGWVFRVAQNRLLDLLRREKKYQELLASWDSGPESCESAISAWFESERLADAQLRMMFVCCYPEIDKKSQLILALKTLCGFNFNELSRCLLQSSEALKKRWQRAKKQLADAQASLELPNDEQLIKRSSAVCQMIYLLFNEGYSPAQGDDPLKQDICKEAMRLCRILCDSNYSNAKAHALMALCCFHYARFDSRCDDTRPIMLKDQDRSQWNSNLIQEGQRYLSSAQSTIPSTYYYEACIAYEHCSAKSFELTDWRSIAEAYGALYQLKPSPLYMLNQAIVLIELAEWDMSRKQLDYLKTVNELKASAHLDCAYAYLFEKTGDYAQAKRSYKRALKKNIAAHEQAYIEQCIELLETK